MYPAIVPSEIYNKVRKKIDLNMVNVAQNLYIY